MLSREERFLMQTKSKRRRQKISRYGKFNTSKALSIDASPDIVNPAVNTITPLADKPSSDENRDLNKYLFSEIKWIAIVTGIIIIILVISYIVFY
jgi:hypothetical protein